MTEITAVLDKLKDCVVLFGSENIYADEFSIEAEKILAEWKDGVIEEAEVLLMEEARVNLTINIGRARDILNSLKTKKENYL